MARSPNGRSSCTAFAASVELPHEPHCHIEILSAPPEHAGLGTGTQLGLAMAAGLDALAGRLERDALAGRRLSAVANGRPLAHMVSGKADCSSRRASWLAKRFRL